MKCIFFVAVFLLGNSMVPLRAAVFSLPGGVAAPDAMVGVVIDRSGGVDAIDLRDGEVRWHSDEVSEPLAIVDEYVVGQRRDAGLVLAVMSLADGTIVMRGTPENLPVPSFTDDRARSYVHVACSKPNKIILEWQKDDRYTGGAPPSARVLESLKEASSGVIAIDLANDKIAVQPSGAGETCPQEPIEAPPEVTSDTYWTGGEWSSQPFQHGREFYVIDKAADDPEGGVRVRPAAGDSSQRGHKLADSKDALVQLALNNDFIIVRQPIGGDTDQVRVFEVASGKQVAEFDAAGPGWEDAVVVDDRIVVAQQGAASESKIARTLIGLDLKTGQMVWERPLRDIVKSKPRLRP